MSPHFLTLHRFYFLMVAPKAAIEDLCGFKCPLVGGSRCITPPPKTDLKRSLQIKGLSLFGGGGHRTDKGVHALANVAHVDINRASSSSSERSKVLPSYGEGELKRALNVRLKGNNLGISSLVLSHNHNNHTTITHTHTHTHTHTWRARREQRAER